MADSLFGDSSNYAPDEITVEGTKYRRADLPNIINPTVHLFPLVEQEKPADGQPMTIFPLTNTVIVTPETVDFNGRTYRRTK